MSAATSYPLFAKKLVARGVLTDPWLDGEPRFVAAPVVLASDAWRDLTCAAEDVARVMNEVARIVEREPALVDSFWALTPYQKLMWLASAPLWHGLARADLFITEDGGVRACELNSDTPSGEAEAIELNALATETAPGAWNPNVGLESAYCDLVCAFAETVATGRADRTIGIIYPTEITEDLSMVELYRRWFAKRGWRVVLGSPFNLEAGRDGDARLMGEPCRVMVRHYKTDWWGERESAWLGGEVLRDAAPLERELGVLLGAVLAGRVAVVNPFGSVLTQNKRAMAFCWERIGDFSAAAQAAIRRVLPETRRLEAFSAAALAAEKDAWVLKSDYGCEGDEVVVGRDVTSVEWADALRTARPGRWVAQRWFDAQRDANGCATNFGVYVVAGCARGVFTRVARGATDVSARAVATLVEREEEGIKRKDAESPRAETSFVRSLRLDAVALKSPAGEGIA
ncbi:MAG: glutathionylspermidine synthase family protein [Deltaproteobacteria bacterium]|nr:glutathionylspermidine synthase family protein [Deltaproteobacteria bacterium]